MSMTRVRFGLRGAEVLGLPFLGVLETLVVLLFLSGGSRYVLKDVARQVGYRVTFLGSEVALDYEEQRF